MELPILEHTSPRNALCDAKSHARRSVSLRFWAKLLRKSGWSYLRLSWTLKAIDDPFHSLYRLTTLSIKSLSTGIRRRARRMVHWYFVVYPEYRRHRIGRKLLVRSRKQRASKRHHKIALNCRRNTAYKLYEKLVTPRKQAWQGIILSYDKHYKNSSGLKMFKRNLVATYIFVAFKTKRDSNFRVSYFMIITRNLS